MIRVSHRECAFGLMLSNDDEVDVIVTYSGYDDPGRTTGLPENCYPPEGEINVEDIRWMDGRKADYESLDQEEQARIEERLWDDMSEAKRERCW